MAKNMARIENGIVTNIEWCADDTPESEYRKDMLDIPAGIGDSYQDGQYYRDGEVLLSSMDTAMAEIAALRSENADMQSALEILEVKPDAEVE